MLIVTAISRYTVGKRTPEPKRDIGPTDFGSRASIRMNFPRGGSSLTPTHDSCDFKWKDYCPMVFRSTSFLVGCHNLGAPEKWLFRLISVTISIIELKLSQRVGREASSKLHNWDLQHAGTCGRCSKSMLLTICYHFVEMMH
jgi:hypothetical protein